ncbi:MAG: hypothetical protein RIR52_2564, partial [Acidobacteriota bacterium]
LGAVSHRGGDEEAAREQWANVVSQEPDREFKARARKRLDEIKSSRP